MSLKARVSAGVAIAVCMSVLACGGSGDEGSPSSSSDPTKLVDARDGTVYPIQAFGTQSWMTTNLAVGVVVEGAGDGDEGAINRVCPQTYPEPSDPSPCDLYGGYYDWSVAMALPSSCNGEDCGAMIQQPHRGICPEGWHIPSKQDFQALADYLATETGLSAVNADGEYTELGAAIRVNSACEMPGTEAPPSGFNGLPSGYANDTGYISADGYWTFWQTTTQDVGYSYGWGFQCSADGFSEGEYYKSHALPVRCVKD